MSIKAHDRWSLDAVEGMMWTRQILKKPTRFNQEADISSTELYTKDIQSVIECSSPCCIAGWMRLYAITRGTSPLLDTKLVLRIFYKFTFVEASCIYIGNGLGWKSPYSDEFYRTAKDTSLARYKQAQKQAAIARAYLLSIITTGKVHK